MANKQFETVSTDQIPSAAAEQMLSLSRKYNRAPKHELEDLENTLRLDHPDGSASWLSQHGKTYAIGEPEFNTYVVDTTPSGEVAGIGEIRFAEGSEDPYYKDKPFVGWTETQSEFGGQGLGRRRLQVMNMASLALYDHALHSDTVHSHPAVPKMWEKLVDEGVAARYEQSSSRSDKKHTRYRFL